MSDIEKVWLDYVETSHVSARFMVRPEIIAEVRCAFMAGAGAMAALFAQGHGLRVITGPLPYEKPTPLRDHMTQAVCGYESSFGDDFEPCDLPPGHAGVHLHKMKMKVLP